MRGLYNEVIKTPWKDARSFFDNYLNRWNPSIPKTHRVCFSDAKFHNEVLSQISVLMFNSNTAILQGLPTGTCLVVTDFVVFIQSCSRDLSKYTAPAMLTKLQRQQVYMGWLKWKLQTAVFHSPSSRHQGKGWDHRLCINRASNSWHMWAHSRDKHQDR